MHKSGRKVEARDTIGGYNSTQMGPITRGFAQKRIYHSAVVSPKSWVFRTFGEAGVGSSGRQYPQAQEVELGAAVPLAFEPLQPGDLSLCLAGTPGEREVSTERRAVGG